MSISRPGSSQGGGSGLRAERQFPAAFRMGSAGAGETGGLLEEQLRVRLRVISVVWMCVTATVGVTALIVHMDRVRLRPLALFSEPPLPGLLLIITFVTTGFIWLLAPGKHIGIRALRAAEWAEVAIAASFFGANQILGLRAGLAYDIRENAMDLGAGLATPWAAAVVAYGVLIPSSARQCGIRTAVLAVCAFLPELIIFPGTIGLSAGVPGYLAIKSITIAAMSALAIYGAYRIDVLRNDVQEARKLGQYVLRKRLGEGGMGEVHLAEHQFLRRSCAVKLIRPEQAGDEETLARFEREVRAAARLTHPNTIQIYDYGRADDGTFYYAMEYLPGISLQQFVDQHGPLPGARAVRVLSQLCGALSEAHACGLVHRDIKPGNVMLCQRGGIHDVAKLLDYGLVAAIRVGDVDTKLTQTGAVVGTPGFMSPEQCAGDDHVTSASDIYSLGALAYFLLSGHEPFGGRSAFQMMAAHLYEAPMPLTERQPNVVPALSAVISRCMAKSPGERYADMSELDEAFLRAVHGTAWTERDARDWWQAHGTPDLAESQL